MAGLEDTRKLYEGFLALLEKELGRPLNPEEASFLLDTVIEQYDANPGVGDSIVNNPASLEQRAEAWKRQQQLELEQTLAQAQMQNEEMPPDGFPSLSGLIRTAPWQTFQNPQYGGQQSQNEHQMAPMRRRNDLWDLYQRIDPRVRRNIGPDSVARRVAAEPYIVGLNEQRTPSQGFAMDPTFTFSNRVVSPANVRVGFQEAPEGPYASYGAETIGVRSSAVTPRLLQMYQNRLASDSITPASFTPRFSPEERKDIYMRQQYGPDWELLEGLKQMAASGTGVLGSQD